MSTNRSFREAPVIACCFTGLENRMVKTVNKYYSRQYRNRHKSHSRHNAYTRQTKNDRPQTNSGEVPRFQTVRTGENNIHYKMCCPKS